MVRVGRQRGTEPGRGVKVGVTVGGVTTCKQGLGRGQKGLALVLPLVICRLGTQLDE